MSNDNQHEYERRRSDDSLESEADLRLPNPEDNTPSLLQTTLDLEEKVRQRTVKLTRTLADLKRTNHQLTKAKEIAEQANLSKTRFLAAASHDVLQPLNAALLLMSTLSAVQNSDEGHRLCRQVERSLETMDTLLRDLLFMSRLDAGDVKPHFQTISVDELFDSIASDFQPIAQVRNLELRVRHSGLHVRSDPTMLRRVIQNIAANALRYTRAGGALLVAGKRGGQVHIRIADTGVGIERDRFDDIFVEFQRCSQGQDDDTGSSAGLGLGLAIVERMLRTLDHHLSLNSVKGVGTCFKLRLPYAAAPQSMKTSAQTSARNAQTLPGVKLANCRVLVIENDLAALQALDALLNQWGCKLRLASSAREAMRALSKEHIWTPEIIIADQHLDNGETGTSVIRVLRQLIGKRIPAVIVTADPSEQLWKMAGQNRFDVMQKPIKPAQLRALLTHLRMHTEEMTA